MSDHTSTPWEFCKKGRRWAIYPKSAVNDGIDYFVAEMLTIFEHDHSVEKANAAFIVEVCNAWDNVERLKARILELEQRK